MFDYAQHMFAIARMVVRVPSTMRNYVQSYVRLWYYSKVPNICLMPWYAWCDRGVKFEQIQTYTE